MNAIGLAQYKLCTVKQEPYKTVNSFLEKVLHDLQYSSFLDAYLVWFPFILLTAEDIDGDS